MTTGSTAAHNGVPDRVSHNVKSLVLEKYHQRLAAPKAHALCPRSLEICRQCGLDTREIRSLGTPRDDAYWVNFLTNLSGERIGVLPYERMDFAVLDETPEMIHNIPQPDFEEFVYQKLRVDPNTETLNTVTTTVEERDTGRRYSLRSRHLIACDGAKSQVRKVLKVASEGEETFKDRVGMLHWITDPACSGFIIAYNLSGDQSEAHPTDSWDEELCRQVVSAALGQEGPFKVLSWRPWVLSRKVAEIYRVGNVFLAGDAAHSFPPTGGLGLNSGLADVHNLAYKIAASQQGWAGGRLLDSYQADRRHVALVNSAQSVKNGTRIFSFLKALGLAGINDVEVARANLSRSIHDLEKQQMIAEEVEAQREHFDNLEIHIGYVYGANEVPPNASRYVPKWVPGARLPHAWIKFLHAKEPPGFVPIDVSYVKEWESDEVSARTASTLDLCPLKSFSLITSSAGTDWPACFQALKTSVAKRGIAIHFWTEGHDFEFVYPQQKSLFGTQGNFNSGGAILA
ncbi:hypothetical protein LA080_002643 [Diaporthe eres]|nr:hypothetical protein LA080_002643 [Diaporthe eres]